MTETPFPAVAPAGPAAVVSPSGSQSKLSPILFFVLLAAALFRILTTVTETGSGAAGEPGKAGLVRWASLSTSGETAQASGKPILYDFTAEWCGPCRMLDADGWQDAKVAALVNDNYVPVRVLDRVREEGRNPAVVDELQRRYGVNAFPTLVVAAPDGRQIAVSQGYAGKEKLVLFLESSRPSSTAAPPITR